MVIATRNPGKVHEWSLLLGERGIRAYSLEEMGLAESAEEDSIEVYDTFEENARAKARWYAAHLPGRLVIADDSGLMVDALHGAPGVKSRRWCGREDLSGAALYAENNRKLLHELEGVGALSSAERSARFVCVAASALARTSAGEFARDFACEFEREELVRGECEGWILTAQRGTGGFGYDPLFFSTDLGQGFGESGDEAKSAVSHRGRAMQLLVALL